MSAGVTARGISVAYAQAGVLHNVDVAVGAGEIVGLIGPNGAGKTTLLKALGGLLPYGGTIHYGDANLQHLSHRQRACLRAYVPQATPQPFPFSVADVVAMATAHQHRWYAGTVDPKKIVSALADVGCHIAPERRFDALSGGEQQQVLLARALAQSPANYLLDEPTSNLDLGHCLQSLGALRRVAQQGAAVLLSLHDLTLASLVCHRLVLLHQGQVMATGTPTAVLRPAMIEEVWQVPVCRFEHPRLNVPIIALEPHNW